MLRAPTLRQRLVCLTLTAAILPAMPSRAQPPLIEDGRITQARGKIGQIVRLKLTEEGLLRVDQSRWQPLAADRNDDQRFADLVAMHLRRRTPRSVAERMARDAIQREARQNTRPVMRLFEELKTALDISSGGSGRSGQNYWMSGRSTAVSTWLAWHEQTSGFHISIVQSQPTHQAIQIDDEIGSGFRFSCLTPQLVLLLVQRPNGSIVATCAADDENHALVSPSFDEMRTEHKEFYKRLSAVWDEVGISGPE